MGVIGTRARGAILMLLGESEQKLSSQASGALAFDENAGYRIRYPYIKSPYKIIMFSVFSVTGIV